MPYLWKPPICSKPKQDRKVGHLELLGKTSSKNHPEHISAAGSTDIKGFNRCWDLAGRRCPNWSLSVIEFDDFGMKKCVFFHLWMIMMIYLLNLMMFYSYVKSPEGRVAESLEFTQILMWLWLKTRYCWSKFISWLFFFKLRAHPICGETQEPHIISYS